MLKSNKMYGWMFGSAVLSVLAVAMMAVAQDEIEPRQSPYAEYSHH